MRMQVRTAVTKAGCKMADSGSVLFNFQRQGLLFVSTSFSEDEAGPFLGTTSHVFPHGMAAFPTAVPCWFPVLALSIDQACRHMMQACRTYAMIRWQLNILASA